MEVRSTKITPRGCPMQPEAFLPHTTIQMIINEGQFDDLRKKLVESLRHDVSISRNTCLLRDGRDMIKDLP